MDIGGTEGQDRKVPTHEVTYVQLRNMVLTGGLAPGQAVTIQGLIKELNAGMTPVREAIRRLTAEGALTLHGNRRVSVPRLTATLLDQIAFARLTVEPKIAELAAPRLSGETIERLVEIDAGIDPAIRRGDIPAYLTGNHLFHFTLYEASGAQVLVEIAQSLWLRFGPSLRVVAARYSEGRLPDRHLDALEAARAGDGRALARAIEADIAQGVDMVRQALQAGEV
ncbi:GntR family transcriptional regulator [Frigidibacter sp. RF13]|uniref:GntR family transcriptional regulator n=1 Tax=Frigidibacter sp. RF13 TaxID=2997340 RepID=UPI0022717502|nr:GntR family transcriptional regulator [Frigidibacter sp. RF13]MCY1125873.1 GntR family transcriptional regulator [Frigidibacter sp. RF13]